MNVVFLQNFIMNNANVSKKIYEKRHGSVKKATELQNYAKSIATIVTNVIAQILYPDCKQNVAQNYGISNILHKNI